MTFPVVTVEDMVRAQFLLLDHLGIQRVHATVGSSLGGMQSLMASAMYPDRVDRYVNYLWQVKGHLLPSSIVSLLYRTVTISACVQTHPSSIAMRYVQRRILMADPNWNNGRYYGNTYPRMGMQHAR